MSCSTTWATRMSSMVCCALRTAAVAASSHDVGLVPISSVTLYTLMPASPARRTPQPRTGGQDLSRKRALRTVAWGVGSAGEGGAVPAGGEHGEGDEWVGEAESERNPG